MCLMNFFPQIITNSKFIPRYIIKNIFSPFACHHFFLSRLALALLAHFVSSLTALSKISTFFILPVPDLPRKGHDHKAGNHYGGDIRKRHHRLRRKRGKKRICPPAYRQREQMHEGNGQDGRDTRCVIPVPRTDEYHNEAK